MALTTACVNNTLFMYGGISSTSQSSSNLWRFNCSSFEWSLIIGSGDNVISNQVLGNMSQYSPTVTPGSRFGGAALYDPNSNSFAVANGCQTFSTCFGSIQQLDLASKLWRTRFVTNERHPSATDPGFQRIGSASFYDQQSRSLYYFGGRHPHTLNWREADLFQYSFDSQGWSNILSKETLKGFPEAPKELSDTAHVYDQRSRILYMFGGTTFSGQVVGHVNHVWSFSLERLEWVLFAPFDSELDSQGNYGPIGVSSRNFFPHSRQKAFAALNEKGELLIFGGEFTDTWRTFRSFLFSDMWKFNFTNLEWTLLRPGNDSEAGLPSSRSGGFAFYSMENMSFMIWGGRTNSTVTNELWSFREPNFTISDTRPSIVAESDEGAPISSSSQNSSPLPFVIIGVSAAVGVSLMLVLVYCVTYIRSKGRSFNEKKETRDEFDSWAFNTDSRLQKTTGATTINAEQFGLEIPLYLEIGAIDFRIVQVIAAGGGGDVALATSESDFLKQRQLTLIAKVLKGKSDMVAFYQEVSIMHLLSSSKFIAKLVAYCVEPPTILMQYYSLGSLSDYITANSPSTRLLYLLGCDIAQGITEMHHNYLAHLDLKPQNILMNTIDEELVA